MKLKDPKLYKFSLNFTSNGIDNNTKALDFITCDKTKNSKLFNQDALANNYYCFDLSRIFNENLTNFYYSNEVQSNTLIFSIEYDKDYLASLNETYKQELKNSQEIINFFYPQLTFSPNNYEHPLDIHLDFTTFFINPDSVFTNYIGYVETKLEQDENFLFNSIGKIGSVIHVIDQIQNYLKRTNKIEFLAYFELNLDGMYYNKYSRDYKKLPEVLAQLCGIMQPLMLGFSLFIQYFTE